MDLRVRPAPAFDERADWLRRYARNRRRSSRLFETVLPPAYDVRAIPLRHPPVFYEGHLPAFSFNKLVREALGGRSIDPELELLFERGIDPANAAAAAGHERAHWPRRDEVLRFGRACDDAVTTALARADLDDASDPRLARGHAAWTILEHEEMHHETLAYLLHRIPLEHKRAPAGYQTLTAPTDAPSRPRIEVPAGSVTLGVAPVSIAFAWDNEQPEMRVDVARFECDRFPVTNRDWLAFVRDGGPVPAFWIESGDRFRLRGAWETLELPHSWPVWVTNAQARAYSDWAGRRLMTEAEYHRAAFGTPTGEERAFPWGDAPPTTEHGNFDWQRWDPEPVGSRPAGASAWGVHELIGNGWEHTATPFAPFGPLGGFVPHPSYPQYSADFFDGNHYVVKGASPVTPREHLRRSFRNWYYADYPYVFGKFRTVL